VRYDGGPPQHAGRALEPAGNGGPRWMTVARPESGAGHRIRRTGRLFPPILRRMQLTHLGHSCVLVEMADTRILIDPGGFTPDLTPAREIDLIIVTHQHPDHLDRDRLPGLLAANPQVRLLADPQSGALLRQDGIEASTFAAPERIGGVTCTPIGTEHALINAALPIIANVGVRLDAEGEPALYHPGDTLAEDPGPIEVLLFPLNAPWQASREMTAFLQRMQAPTAVPIHDGLLRPNGREIYLGQARTLGHPDTQILDLADGAPRTLSAG
jgi:L-ascorbate metabolism protein UlaG (beta-lactamase superfamily)